MNRLFLLTAAALTAPGLAAAPAVAGLAHNPSFSHQLPVRAPSGAQAVELGDDSALTVPSSTASSRPTPTASPSATPSRSRTAEPGDDHGGGRTRRRTPPAAADPRGSPDW